MPSIRLSGSLLVILMASAHALRAEPMRAVSLREAIAEARQHQPELLAAQARLAAARADTSVPRARWLPKVGATAQAFAGTANNSTASTLGSGLVDLPRVGGTKGQADDAWSPLGSSVAAVGVHQQLWDFGRTSAQSDAADALAQVGAVRSDAADADVVVGAVDAWCAVRAAQEVLAAAQRGLERSRAHREEAEASVQQGLRASVDLLRAEAEVARARVVVARANGALLSARGNLAAALGAQEFQVDARADAASERPAAALEPIDDAGAQALAHDPELRAAQAELTAQEAQTRVVAAEDRPELFASASLSGRAGGAPLSSGATVSGGGLLPSVPNWDLGVVFQLPVYDGVARARVDAARERERSVRAEVAAVRARVIAQVQFAWAGARTAEDTLPELQRATDAARANQQQVSARFVSGLGSTVDVVDAEALLIDAEVQLALGTFEVLRARARLARLTAQELP